MPAPASPATVQPRGAARSPRRPRRTTTVDSQGRPKRRWPNQNSARSATGDLRRNELPDMRDARPANTSHGPQRTMTLL